MPKDIERTLSGCFHPKEGKSNLRKISVNIERARQNFDLDKALKRINKAMESVR